MVNQISNINFKADTAAYPAISYNNRYTPPMPADTMDDIFLAQVQEQSKAAKKEQSKERWYKTGIVAQVGLAVAFGIMAIGTIVNLKRGGNGAGKNNKLAWKDIAKEVNFPSLSDDCVNPKVRDFIKSMKEEAILPDSVYKAAGIKKPEQCLLMYGPSGTGKTFSAKMLAKEIGAEYTEVQFADVSSPYIGQTSVEIQNVFKQIKKNAEKNPDKKYLVAFNEIDALLVPREKCGSNNLHLAENRTAFLNGLDDIAGLKNIKIVGTTNVDPKSGNLDKASLSRFKNMIEIDLPNKTELKAALKFHLKGAENVEKHKFFENNEKEVDKFIDKLYKNKYSQRDVEDLAEKARRQFGSAIEKSTNVEAEKFDIKYLEKAFEMKGMTTGAIEAEVIPAWMKIQAPTEKKVSTQTADKPSLIQRLKTWLGIK